MKSTATDQVVQDRRTLDDAAISAHAEKVRTEGWTVVDRAIDLDLVAAISEDLLRLGAGVGLTESNFVSGVQTARYEKWVLSGEEAYQAQDPQGTPAAWLNGRPLGANVLFDPGAFEKALRV